MPDIFDEVEEDLRVDQAQALLRRYGSVLLIAMGFTLIGVGAYTWWQDKQKATAEAVASRYLAASELAKTDAKGALKAFGDLAVAGPEGYQLLARMRLAALEWDQGQRDSALAEWQAVADSKDAPQLMRDTATLAFVEHQIDTGDAAQLKLRLGSVISGKSRLMLMAEADGALLDLRLNRTAEALAVFKSLVNGQDTPAGLRQLARDIVIELSEQGTGQHG